MKLSVDAERCQGHNRCYSLAPELFDVDDNGFATAAGDGTVPPELEPKARLAQANCPELAIGIEVETGAPGSGDSFSAPRPSLSASGTPEPAPAGASGARREGTR